ncbi:MAG: hypothetical protein A3I01_12580 [Betaproteobacteria bacterium RIFCSPLOWO2_02_FULL_65_24]|nr:MAG: hypothetical protein A3I01_12580 [Betaproteobacteria bacterium RIFCSPLOWO2_02_FULL_65_24]OGA85801.1 MAG: hypothetical protein A3G27_16560 [Betaproteobacteria bacterium RIFCSPLOWO2_12_FULL_66_14]
MSVTYFALEQQAWLRDALMDPALDSGTLAPGNEEQHQRKLNAPESINCRPGSGPTSSARRRPDRRDARTFRTDP